MIAAAATCKVSTDLSRDIAIEVTAPDSLEEYDTLKPTARVLRGLGDSAATAVFWFSPDSAIAVLDSTTGRTIVVHTGSTGRLVAKGGGLVSNPLAIRTLPAADTVLAGPTLDTVDIAGPTALDSLSDSLKIEIADTVTAGANPIVPLAGRPVVYTLVHPAVAGPVTLVTQDTARALADTLTAVSSVSGIAFVKVRLLAPDTIPDSVVVVASARRAVGTTVPGSPDTFVVRFRGVAVADTLRAAGPLDDTVHVSAVPPDSLSDSLSVEVGTMGLPGRAVVFAITSPQTPGPVTLVTSDTARTPVTTDTVKTDARGIAAVKVRLVAGPAPASVEVTASATRGVSARLPGSPVRFTVRFEP